MDVSFDTHNDFRLAVEALSGGLLSTIYAKTRKTVRAERDFLPPAGARNHCPLPTWFQPSSVRDRARAGRHHRKRRGASSVNDNARIHVPLVEGEYDRRDAIETRAQIPFMDIVSKYTPAPLYSLRDEVLPRYLAAFSLQARRGRSDLEISGLSTAAVALLCGRGPPNSDRSETERAVTANQVLLEASAPLAV